MEIDHIKPRSKGGDNTYKNNYNQLLHRHCHDSKTASDKKTYPKFRPQDLPDNYIWIDDMLTRFAGCTLDLGRLREEP